MVDFLVIIQSPYFLRSVLAIILIALNAAMAGSFTVFRDISFLVAGTSHAALAGAAFAIVLSVYGVISWFGPLYGAILFAVLTAVAAGYASRKGDKEQINTTIGIAFAMSMSLAVLFISLIREYASQAWGLLLGDLLLLTDSDIILLSVVTLIIVIIMILFYREFIFISFDIEGAVAYGIRAEFFNYLMLILISVSVVVILKGVGAILVFAMLVAPAAAANRLVATANRVIIVAFILAITSGFVGLLISFYISISAGALAALIATCTYFIVILIKR